MAERTSIIIIGAGLAGLAAGSYGQMNGYRTTVYDMHFIPGGSCTGWKRGDYIFDYCISWMWGTGKGFASNQLFREIGALGDQDIRDFDEFNRVLTTSGQLVNFYVDPNKLEEHLLTIAPEDKANIKEYCDGVRKMKDIDVFESIFMHPSSLAPWSDKLKFGLTVLKHFRFFARAHETSTLAFRQRLKSPALREAFKYVFPLDLGDTFPLIPHYSTLATSWKKNTGFPSGGSLGVARGVARRYEELGGKIVYRKKVKRILVHNHCAVGVEFADGSTDFADIIISACDGRTVIYDFLDGRYVTPKLEKLYKELAKEPHIHPGWVTVFLGVNMDLSPMPASVTHILSPEDAAQLPALAMDGISIQNRTKMSDGFAPPGKSVVMVVYNTDYDYWRKIYDADQSRYYAEKKQAADFIIKRLDATYPGLKDKVEEIDVSTPVTMLRYTGNHRGSPVCWKAFSAAEKLAEKFGNGGMKLPGLRNFYMSGQWSLMGALIRAACSGRFAIQYACRDDRKKFQAYKA